MCSCHYESHGVSVEVVDSYVVSWSHDLDVSKLVCYVLHICNCCDE